MVITFTFQQHKNLISSHHSLHFSLSIFGIPLTIITMNNSDNAVVRDKLHQHTKSRPKKLSNTSIKMDLEVWILRSFRESWNKWAFNSQKCSTWHHLQPAKDLIFIKFDPTIHDFSRISIDLDYDPSISWYNVSSMGEIDYSDFIDRCAVQEGSHKQYTSIFVKSCDEDLGNQDQNDSDKVENKREQFQKVEILHLFNRQNNC